MAYSPCPNDTFMFHDVAAGILARAGYEIGVHLHDIETLNRLALAGRYDLTKVSFHAWLLARAEYRLLNVGAALGCGCGPLVVGRLALTRAEVCQARIAVPGELTTAHLLLRLWAPAARRKLFVPYDQVLDRVLVGEADCGVIIHESRFVYQDAGLVCLADLGQWWEEHTGHPIPLGCVIARRCLGDQVATDLEGLLREAIRHSQAHPEQAMAYVRQQARELDDAVLHQHIDMFVTDFSLDLGERGRAAVEALERLAREAEVIA
jgi:1,4-dihydroxy-6-naphthoate synthase